MKIRIDCLFFSSSFAGVRVFEDKKPAVYEQLA